MNVFFVSAVVNTFEDANVELYGVAEPNLNPVRKSSLHVAMA